MKTQKPYIVFFVLLTLGAGFACKDNPISAGTEIELQPIEGTWAIDLRIFGEDTENIKRWSIANELNS